MLISKSDKYLYSSFTQRTIINYKVEPDGGDEDGRYYQCKENKRTDSNPDGVALLSGSPSWRETFIDKEDIGRISLLDWTDIIKPEKRWLLEKSDGIIQSNFFKRTAA
jgi:hypothetical protein